MGSIFMRFPNGKPRALTLSYDDGVQQDARLIEIMQKHGLKGTFNLNSGLYAPIGTVYEKGTVHRRMEMQQCTDLYKSAGMEVAVHGLTHPFLEQLPCNICTNEIIADRLNLEQQFGTIVRGMAYPFGTYSDDVVNVLKSCGIVYSRTVESTRSFDIPTDWLRLNPTCHHDDPELFELLNKFLATRTDRAPQMFYLWGHSYEFERDDNWSVIEAFAEKASAQSDVWYATNIEIYSYIEAFNQLQFSADGKIVYNPTAITLWFMQDDKLIKIAPAQTL